MGGGVTRGAFMRHYFILRVAVLSLILCGSGAGAKRSGPPVGSVAPDFDGHDVLTHETLTLSAQAGKVVIVTFWASWCPPCRRELPILSRAQEIVGKDKLTVLAVNHKEKEDRNTIRRIASALRINVIEDRNNKISELYEINGIPHLFIISRNGKVLANHLGYGDRTIAELVADLNHALADEVPAERETLETENPG